VNQNATRSPSTSCDTGFVSDGQIVSFPERSKDSSAHRYYDSHFRFILRIFQANGCKVEYYLPTRADLSDCRVCRVGFAGIQIAFDVSDHLDDVEERLLVGADVVFKFHYCASIHGERSNAFPFSPVSFFDWSEYYSLSRALRYTATGPVLNNQRPHTQNWLRRNAVQSVLRQRYGTGVDVSITDQLTFWNKISHSLVSVCVPGARVDILDRGQLQYMAFGGCTVSPKLRIDLPFGRQLIANTHYLECANDWSNLVERVEYAREHPELCLMIGANAKRLFQDSLTEKALFRWIQRCTRERVT
jgi:hypothetical protein